MNVVTLILLFLAEANYLKNERISLDYTLQSNTHLENGNIVLSVSYFEIQESSHIGNYPQK